MCKITFALQELETADVVQGVCNYYGFKVTSDCTLSKVLTLTHDTYYTPDDYDPSQDISLFRETGELPHFFMRMYCSDVLGLDMDEVERKMLV